MKRTLEDQRKGNVMATDLQKKIKEMLQIVFLLVYPQMVSQLVDESWEKIQHRDNKISTKIVTLIIIFVLSTLPSF